MQQFEDERSRRPAQSLTMLEAFGTRSISCPVLSIVYSSWAVLLNSKLHVKGSLTQKIAVPQL